MDKSELEKQFFSALDEYTAACTVVITSENPEVPHGSGVAVHSGGKEYILTVAHVLRNEPDNAKLKIIGKPDGPLVMLRRKEELRKQSRSGRFLSDFHLPLQLQ